MNQQLLTRKEAAEFLRVSKAFLDMWTVKGRIPRVKMGRKVLYRLQDLQKIVEAGGLVNDWELAEITKDHK